MYPRPLLIVRTPMGLFGHFADSGRDVRTYCGKEFSVGFDKTQPYSPDIPAEELCSRCLDQWTRRQRREETRRRHQH